MVRAVPPKGACPPVVGVTRGVFVAVGVTRGVLVGVAVGVPPAGAHGATTMKVESAAKFAEVLWSFAVPRPVLSQIWLLKRRMYELEKLCDANDVPVPELPGRAHHVASAR